MNAPSVQASKSEWRSWGKLVRSGLPDASEAVCLHLEGFLRTLEPRAVLAYRAFGNEVDLEALHLRHPQLTWLTTRTNDRDELSLHAFSSATERTRWGILEPGADALEHHPEIVDVALVPGLVFDARGGRLGYGRGYYDRLLPRLRAGVPLIGVTRDALVVPELPLEDFDVRMTHLATESGVVRAVLDSPA